MSAGSGTTLSAGPIKEALDSVQSDGATLSDSAEKWMDLLMNEDLMPHKVKVQARTNQSLGPAHAAENLLDPRYFGRKLSDELRHETEASLGDEFLADAVLLETQHPPYPETFLRPEFIRKVNTKAMMR